MATHRPSMTTPVDGTTRRAPYGARREEEQMVMPMPAGPGWQRQGGDPLVVKG
jgi:hypothetical protein